MHGRLDRFISIDKDLGHLRDIYPNVPIMALTATANDKVKMDVKINLKIPKCMEFAMSFNRPNLIYEIIKKTKTIDDDIVKMIRERWKNRSGIIYCTSKKACEQVAETLQKNHKISACHYHAGLEKEDRMAIQESWASNKIQVIVATVSLNDTCIYCS